MQHPYDRIVLTEFPTGPSPRWVLGDYSYPSLDRLRSIIPRAKTLPVFVGDMLLPI